MQHYLKQYAPAGNPAAPAQAVVGAGLYRFTVLTSRMLRLEYHPDGRFMDFATQTVVNRAFPPVDFQVREDEGSLEIITRDLHLRYNKQPFSPQGLSVELVHACSFYHNRWYYGDLPRTLQGTARTLDEADGAVPLSQGLMSGGGISLIDDSGAAYFGQDGLLHPREEGCVDLYLLGYGHDYLGCLADFYTLSGPTPLLPRFALGNWWSRYHPYTQETYRALMERFAREGVPLSVSVIDMDWHLTELEPQYGSGWTGYTWNRTYFPDPKAFLEELHRMGLRVTLNVHPADGCRAYEEAYPQVAEALGVKNGEKVDFDASDPRFLEAYLRFLHHPHEALGVDFWWVDWQQAGGSRIKGLDPLFILNHYHYHDNGRDGKAALVLSRYAGLGSHRTPVGFSGDTVASWESLDFQPYFTATASNVGYGWWSHDIGGHMHGVKDDELALRWLQFGVFSPIMRLHSGCNPFMVKEPWAYDSVGRAIARRFLRLRHQLLPYLHTMNLRAHAQGLPLVQPMYYGHGDTPEAYQVPNQYCFGSELMVCPITKPMHPELLRGAFDAWLPPGTYYDLFNGRRYRGGRRLRLHRSLDAMPVLARAGGIVPLAAEETLGNGVDLPAALDILLFAGAEGSFTLFEDEGQRQAFTPMALAWGDALEFEIQGVTGDAALPPPLRRVTLRLYGLGEAGELKVQGTALMSREREGNVLVLRFGPMDSARGMRLWLETGGSLAPNDILGDVLELLSAARIPYDLKTELMERLRRQPDASLALSELIALNLEEGLLSALAEIITA